MIRTHLKNLKNPHGPTRDQAPLYTLQDDEASEVSTT